MRQGSLDWKGYLMKLKMIGIVAASALMATSAAAQVGVSGHYRSNGTYVAPHVRTNPNNTVNDNWTTRPNVNPYTGQAGTRSPSYGSSSYGSTPSYTAPRQAYGSSYGTSSSSSSSSRSSSYGSSSRTSSYGSGYNPRY